MSDISSKNAIRHSGMERLAQRLWFYFWSVFCRTTPWFLRRWRIACLKGASLLSGGGVHISWNTAVASSARIDYPWKLMLGASSSIGDYSWVQCQDVVQIGANCCIGEYVRIISGSHDLASPNFDLVTKPIKIMNNAWVATGATILQGVTIGEGAVVAAGSVVTKDVEPWTVVGGNPAKFIKKRELKV